MNSFNGYFSVTKINFVQVYEKKAEDLACFAPRKWKRLREYIVSIKTNQAQREGKVLFNGAELVSDQDVKILSMVCLWERTQKGAAFFAFNKSTYHLIAQSCEGAQQLKKI